MKRSLCYALLFLSLSCEVRPAKDQRGPAPKQEPKTIPAPPESMVVVPPEPIKPKTTPGIPEGALGEAMSYSLPNATGLFVIDIERLAKSAMLGPVLAQVPTWVGSDAAWRELISKAGLDPLRDLRGVVASFRQPTGGTTEILMTFVGTFDAAAISKAMHDSTTRGESDAVLVGKNILLVGKTPLLAEAKLAAERGLLVDAPLMLAALSGLDVTRPVYGAFFPPAATRAAAHGSERANQVTTEFDASQELYLKILFHFDTPKEAEDSKVELDDALKQMGPMMGIFGIPDTSALLKAFVIKTDGARLSFLLSLDSTTAATIIAGVARFSGGAAVSPAPAPVPPPAPAPVLPPG